MSVSVGGKRVRYLHKLECNNGTQLGTKKDRGGIDGVETQDRRNPESGIERDSSEI